MIVRKFKPKDLKRVIEIENMSFEDPYPPQLLLDIYNLGAGFLVAQEDNMVVGYIIFWIKFEDEGHIISLAVDKKYRRQKIGTRLVNTAIDIFRMYGIKNIKLEVRAKNRGAIRFYKTLGFEEERKIPRYYENGDDAVVMKKECDWWWLND